MSSAAAQRPRDGGHPQRGFTMAEVLVALVIFAIGALTLVSLIPAGVESTTDAGIHTRASALAAARCELLLQSPFASGNVVAGNHLDPDNPHDGKYHVQWTVVDDQPVAGCKRVTVTTHEPTVASPPAVRLVIVLSELDG